MIWYGYQHIDSSIHVERFLNHGDIVEVESSPYVKRVVYPFIEATRIEAIKAATKFIEEGEA